jgi:hypothetical protein
VTWLCPTGRHGSGFYTSTENTKTDFEQSRVVSVIVCAENREVVSWDDFSTGKLQFVEDAQVEPRFALIEGDNLFSVLGELCDLLFKIRLSRLLSRRCIKLL